MRPKITVVGAGNVGGTTALFLALSGQADVVLLDIIDGLAAGKALDLAQALPVLGIAADVAGTTEWSEAEGSDVVIVTSGVARKPGMSRDDLLAANVAIVASVSERVRDRCPEAVLIVVSNPLDAMAQLAYEVTRFDRPRVLGMAGVLDTARFRCFVGEEAGVPGADVAAMVLGSHGDLMVPLPAHTSIGGIPASELLDAPTLGRLVERTAQGGAEIVSLLGTGSAYVAPAASAAAMAQAIVQDSGRVLPCSVLLTGEFGIDGVFVGVPARLGAEGLTEVLEIALADEELGALRRSAEAVRVLVDRMHDLRTGA